MPKSSPKGDARKVELAKLLRRHTLYVADIDARRRRIGSASYVSYLISQPTTIVDCENPFFAIKATKADLVERRFSINTTNRCFGESPVDQTNLRVPE